MSDRSSKPLITTIIPTYRRPKLLRRAIQSILNQTYPHFQVCVYDNASGDETSDVVSDFAKKDSRVKYHCHPETIGVLENFAYGIDHVDSPLFSCLSDDDLLLPDFYKLAVEKLELAPEAAFVAGATIHVNEVGLPLIVDLQGWKEGLYEPPLGLLSILKKGRPNWTGIVFRRVYLKEYRKAVGSILHDLDFELRIALWHKFYATPTPVGLLSVHPARISTSLSWSDILGGINEIKGGLVQRYAEDSEMGREILRRWKKFVARIVLGETMQRLISGQSAEVIKMTTYCMHELGYAPTSCILANLLARIGISNEKLANLVGRSLACVRRVVDKKRVRRNRKYLEKYGIKLSNIGSALTELN